MDPHRRIEASDLAFCLAHAPAKNRRIPASSAGILPRALGRAGLWARQPSWASPFLRPGRLPADSNALAERLFFQSVVRCRRSPHQPTIVFRIAGFETKQRAGGR
jgi:hypothetical protein